MTPAVESAAYLVLHAAFVSTLVAVSIFVAVYFRKTSAERRAERRRKKLLQKMFPVGVYVVSKRHNALECGRYRVMAKEFCSNEEKCVFAEWPGHGWRMFSELDESWTILDR